MLNNPKRRLILIAHAIAAVGALTMYQRWEDALHPVAHGQQASWNMFSRRDDYSTNSRGPKFNRRSLFRGGFTIAPRSPFAVGPSPYPLTLGDVNNDGRLDIIANATATGLRRAEQLPRSRALTVLLNDGQGGFKATEIPLRTREPWSAVVGDLNRDGKPDIVATHHDQNKLTVLLGNGAGGFQEVADSPFVLGHNVWRLELADVNGDRQLDVLVAAGNSVQVLLGDGAGRFKVGEQASLLTGGGTWRLAIGDLNKDGKPDVVASNAEGNSVSIFFAK